MNSFPLIRPHDLAPLMRQAFSLVELLVVIAVIGVLALIVIPVVDSVRISSRESAGVSNIRQIGVVTSLYAAEHHGELPVGYRQSSPSTDFSVTLSGQIDGQGMAYYQRVGVPRAEIFKDPIVADDGGVLHYSAHPLLMVSANSPEPMTYSRIGNNPSELVMLMDGSLHSENNAGATAGAVRNIKVRRENFTGNLDEAVPTGEDASTGKTGYIRWSMHGGNAAKFLFVDGHVEIIAKGDLKYANIILE